MAVKKDHLSPRAATILVVFIVGMIMATYLFTRYMLTGSDARQRRSRTGELYKYSVQDARDQKAAEERRKAADREYCEANPAKCDGDPDT